MVKRVLGLLTCFTLVLTFSFISKPLGVHAQTPLISIQIDRLAGNSRYDTAGEIAKYGWSKTSDYAVIANGEDFPDALCSAPLAKKYQAPILLTEKNNLSSQVKGQLQRLKTKHVFVIGGSGVVSSNIDRELQTIKGEKPRVVFMENDTNNGFVKLGMSIDELRALYGKETDMEYQDIQTDGNVYTTLAYPFGKFEFSADEYNPNSFLYWVTITSSDFVGPRDIRVGDKTDSVLENFPDGNYDVKKQEDGTTVRILYGDTWPDKYYGVIDYEGDQMTQIRCSEGGPGFGSYGLTFVIKDGKVASFNYGMCII